jgi:hypothetical protein
MKDPRVDQKALRRDREIMAAFSLTDPRHLIMRVEVPTDLPAEMLDDEIGATRATVRLPWAESTVARITRESGELFSQRVSLFTLWTRGHPEVVATSSLTVNIALRSWPGLASFILGNRFCFPSFVGAARALNSFRRSGCNRNS